MAEHLSYVIRGVSLGQGQVDMGVFQMESTKKKRIMEQLEEAARKVFAYKPPVKQRSENLPSHRRNAYPQDKVENSTILEKKTDKYE